MYPSINKIQTQNQIERLHKALTSDSHLPFYPSHVVEKEGEIIGALSILSVPMLYVWMHSKVAHARDSYFALQVAENLARNAGATSVVLPCKSDSPFYKYLTSLGFSSLVKEISLYEKSIV